MAVVLIKRTMIMIAVLKKHKNRIFCENCDHDRSAHKDSNIGHFREFYDMVIILIKRTAIKFAII